AEALAQPTSRSAAGCRSVGALPEHEISPFVKCSAQRGLRRVPQVRQLAGVPWDVPPGDLALRVHRIGAGALPAGTNGVPVVDPLAGEAHHGRKRSPAGEVPQVAAAETPGAVRGALLVDHEPHTMAGAHGGAPAVGGLEARVAHGDPGDLGPVVSLLG